MAQLQFSMTNKEKCCSWALFPSVLHVAVLYFVSITYIYIHRKRPAAGSVLSRLLAEQQQLKWRQQSRGLQFHPPHFTVSLVSPQTAEVPPTPGAPHQECFVRMDLFSQKQQ